MASELELKDLLTEVASNYSVRKNFDVLVPLWYRMFHAVPLELLLAAVTKHMTESEYFPSVADVWKFLDIKHDAQWAWELAHGYAQEMKSYTNVGAGLSVVQNQNTPQLPEDDVIQETLAIITWQRIAFAEPRDLPFVRKEFLEVFDEQSKQANVMRRAKIIEGDSSQLALQPAYMDAQARREAILRGGQPRAIEAAEIDTEDV